MYEKLATTMNEVQQTRYDEAITRRDKIISYQEMLRNRWRMGKQTTSPS